MEEKKTQGEERWGHRAGNRKREKRWGSRFLGRPVLQKGRGRKKAGEQGKVPVDEKKAIA